MKKLAAVIFVIACSACRAPEKAVPAQMPPQTAASARNVTEAKSQLANPASVNCTKLGGQLEMKTSPLGEYGMCVFADNRQCEEWALFRGECPKGGVDVSGYKTQEEIFCATTGGKVDGGNCIADGRSCALSAYFTHDCK